MPRNDIPRQVYVAIVAGVVLALLGIVLGLHDFITTSALFE